MIPLRFAKLTLGLLLAAPAHANAPAPPPEPRTTPPVVGFFDTGKPHCYLRAYDNAHMVAHPKQKVTALAFAYTPTMTPEGEQYPMWDPWSDERAFTARLAVAFKDDQDAFLLSDAKRGLCDKDWAAD